MLTDGTSNIIEAMKAKGLKRIAVVTSIGAGDSEKQAPFFFRVLMGTVMRGVFEDKNNQEALFLQVCFRTERYNEGRTRRIGAHNSLCCRHRFGYKRKIL